jgi:tetratricopeptide (TPR) repeat protein
VYAERALDADPDDSTKVQTMLMLATGIAQHTREFDLDREEKLGRAEKYANGALDMLKTLPKPNPSLSDEQWNGYKAQMVSDAHEALGMGALVRKSFDQAIKEFKSAVDAEKEPDVKTEVMLAAAYNKAGKYDDALALCDAILKTPNLHPQIQRVAQSERSAAMQGKSGGQKAAAGAAAPSAAPAPTSVAKP